MKKAILAVLVSIILIVFSVVDGFAASKRPAIALIVESGIVGDQGVILVGEKSLVIEPSLQYTHIDSNRINITGYSILPALIIGLIQVQKVKRDIFTPQVLVKYGLTDRIELDLRVPYVYRSDEYITGLPGARNSTTPSDSDLGDIEATVLYHAVREKDGMPDMLAFLKVKSDTGEDPYGLSTQTVDGISIPRNLPTGSGHWAIEPGITFVKSSDPAIIFANLSYFWHIEEDISGLGDVDPGDSINYSIGVGYALNENLVLSTSFDHKIFTKTKIDGVSQVESDVNVASLLLGSSYAFSEKKAITISVSIGLTEEAPDAQLTVKLPMGVR